MSNCNSNCLGSVQLQQGPSGSAGASGDSVAQLSIFIRAAAQPATPTGGSFNFTSQVLTAPTTWYSDYPPHTSNPLWACTGIASVSGTTGTDSSITWSTPQQVVEDGADSTMVPGLYSAVLDNYSILDDGNDYTATSPIKVREFSVPANTFTNNDDEVHIDYGFSGDIIDVNIDGTSETSVSGYLFLQVRLVQGATTRYVNATTSPGGHPFTNVVVQHYPAACSRLKFYKTDTNKLRPVLLDTDVAQVGARICTSSANGNILTSDAAAGNSDNWITAEAPDWLRGLFSPSNVSYAELSGFDFTQAITVEVYMWRGDLTVESPGVEEEITEGKRPQIVLSNYNPAFRLMNLHASYKKKIS